METKEILEGKKTDNLEDTSASEEVVKDNVGNGSEEIKENEGGIPDLATSPVPTEDEVKDAELEVKPEEVINEIAEPEQSEPTLDGATPVEHVAVDDNGPAEAYNATENTSPVREEPQQVEENGVTEMPATKIFTQSQVNEMVGNTRTETREKTFRYIYDRYGVKDEAELDELVGNAQALDSFKEKYETERANWKQSSADRDKELMDVKEQVALLQSGIDSDRFEDAKFILRGKGLEVSLDNIKNELATHPEWQKKIGEQANENFAKVGEGTVDTNQAEPQSKISVLGNERNEGEPQNLEEDYVMNRMFKV